MICTCCGAYGFPIEVDFNGHWVKGCPYCGGYMRPASYEEEIDAWMYEDDYY